MEVFPLSAASHSSSSVEETDPATEIEDPRPHHSCRSHLGPRVSLEISTEFVQAGLHVSAGMRLSRTSAPPGLLLVNESFGSSFSLDSQFSPEVDPRIWTSSNPPYLDLFCFPHSGSLSLLSCLRILLLIQDVVCLSL